jgi:hypothetical protein
LDAGLAEPLDGAAEAIGFRPPPNR